jgi:hypothetical protein
MVMLLKRFINMIIRNAYFIVFISLFIHSYPQQIVSNLD